MSNMKADSDDNNDSNKGLSESISPLSSSSNQQHTVNIIPPSASNETTHHAPLAEPEQTEHHQKHRESIWDTYIEMSDVGERKRRMTRNLDSTDQTQNQEKNLADLGPGARVMFLLKEQDELPALFTEMGELTRSGMVEEWRETARWVKFEEDVEEGGNRWSKPHVATLSLHALFQLRSCLLNGVIIMDSEAKEFSELVEEILEHLVAAGQLGGIEVDEVRNVLSKRHTHQYEQARGTGNGNSSSQSGFLNAVRSISDIGKTFSHGRNLGKMQEETINENMETSLKTPNLKLPEVGSTPKEMTREGSHTDVKGNLHFMKKLPSGAEASNVLIGEVDFLSRYITAFVRLKNAATLGDLTEVPVPTRFFFILLGPTGNVTQYREIGRAIATLMSDEIFHDVAYKARNSDDLLDGVDEFLDQVTVLPPGEWDPNIRIEPPNKVPSQEKRKHGDELSLIKIPAPKKEIEEEDSHANDPALKRTGRLFGGLIMDIKRKVPWYISDFTDSLNLQCVATFCFMYFALLAPIVTFGGLLEEATHQRMAAMENLFGGAICGVIYHLFSGQPLTIIGSTGPVLVFETIVFDLCASLNIDYLSFRFWIHVWTALILFVMVITDASALVSYITRFTEESFATLIAVIFIYEAIMKLVKIRTQLDVVEYNKTDPHAVCRCVGKDVSVVKAISVIEKNNWKDIVGFDRCRSLYGTLEGNGCFVLYDKFLMSLVLMLGTFALAIMFKKMRNTCYFPSRIRQIFSDFAVMIAIVIMTCVDMYVGINTPKLNVPSTFRPTWEGRGWYVPPFNGNPFWTAIVSFIPAILACILIFMDQQITTVIVNRKENKLKKGYGYHLDLCVLSFLIFVVGILGLPIYVAATVLSINHVNSLKLESESRAPGEVAQFIGVREQRVTGIVTFIFIGCSVLMTGVLSHIPMPVLYGVFLYMGIAALGGIQLFDRILLLLMPMKYQPDTIYIRHVPISVIHKFTFCQVACLAVLWTVKSIKRTSIAFPIMLVVMVAVRKVMEKFFTEKDLRYLDDKMPDFHLRKKEDMKRKKSAVEEFDIDLEENQGTIHAVKTEAHLHIPTTSGEIIKIPLAAIQEPSHNIHNMNISNEVNKTGMWKHISSGNNRLSSSKVTSSPEVKHPYDNDEDDDAIIIRVTKPSSANSNVQSNNEETPLLDNQKSETKI
uniref:Anion exchange protein n=1 Tax=Onchocerca volvulus TaxID=6282 RepID=A0A8R1Y235_ONCVO